MRHLLFGLLVASAPLLSACSKSHDASAAEIVREIRTTFYPTTFFAERLVGDQIPVVCPLPSDADPIFWSPTRDDVAAYQRAAAIVVNGAGLEQWVERTSLPSSRKIDTAAGFSDRFLHFESETQHSHGPEGEHAHQGVDGHTWLDPLLAIEQLRSLDAGLARLVPELETTENRLALEAELQALHARFEALDVSNVRLFAAHPAYQYVARRYGWSITNLDLSPEAAPPAGTIERLAETEGSALPILLLWESAPERAASAPLSAVGVRHVVFSPVEVAPASGDFLSAMHANLDALEEASR